MIALAVSAFTLVEACALDTLPEPEPLIAGLLQRDSLALLSGAPGTYKTFLALDWALCVAAGQPWHDRATVAGAVIYIAAEGVRGLKRRVRAWETAYGLPARHCYILPAPVQLLEERDVAGLTVAIDGLGVSPALIVVDTLARCAIGAEENSSREMGLLVDAADELRRRYSVAVLLLHHNGWNGRVRGSSALLGAVDTHLTIERVSETTIVLRCDKQKDAEDFAPLTLKRSVVELADGTTSLVLRATDPAEKPLGRAESKAYTALSKHGGLATATEWEQITDIPRSSFYRVIGGLVRAGHVTKTGTTYTIASRKSHGSPTAVSRDGGP